MRCQPRMRAHGAGGKNDDAVVLEQMNTWDHSLAGGMDRTAGEQEREAPLLGAAPAPRRLPRDAREWSWLMLAANMALWNNGIACCVLSAFLHSIEPVFVRQLARTSPFELAITRSGLSLPITLITMYINGLRSPYQSSNNLPWLLLRGLSGCFTLVFMFTGVKLLTLLDAQTIFQMHPALICVGAFVFLGERMSKVQIFGSLMSLVGVVLLIHPPMIFGGTIHAPLQGVLCVLGASVCVSTVILTIRFLAARETTIVMTLWLHVTEIIVCIPPLVLGWPQPMVTHYSNGGWACLMIIGLNSFASQLFLNRGSQLLSAAKAGTIGTLQVPLSYAWGALLFNEKVSASGLSAACVVVMGLVAVSMKGRQEKLFEADVAKRQSQDGIYVLPQCASL